MKSKIFAAATMAAGMLFGAGMASAASVNGTGILTSNVIYGDGNANGSFTGVTVDRLELALRAHLRYDLTGQPQDIFNYDGDHTYTFDPADSNLPGNRSAFNFDWSINTNVLGGTGLTIGDYTYLLSVDNDPTTATNFIAYDPYAGPFADHSFGNNATAQGTGVEATDPTEFANYKAAYNLSQQSWNMGFGFMVPADQEGIFTVQLEAFQRGQLVAGTSIDIRYGAVPAVPLPASLPLLLGAFGSFAALRRRRKAA